MVVCIVRLVFMSCSVMVSEFGLMFVVYIVLLNMVCVLSLGVCLCNGCNGCCAFCLICDVCLRCSCSCSIFCFVV